MKKIINNKLYDTDTAKRLGYDVGGDGFDSWTEELYKKRTGEYFIYGEGGARTRYGEFVDGPGGGWTSGCKIIPISVDAAREWAENHLSVDEYADIFGLPDDLNEKTTICAQLPSALIQAARIRAAETSQTLTAIIEQALQSHLQN